MCAKMHSLVNTFTIISNTIKHIQLSELQRMRLHTHFPHRNSHGRIARRVSVLRPASHFACVAIFQLVYCIRSVMLSSIATVESFHDFVHLPVAALFHVVVCISLRIEVESFRSACISSWPRFSCSHRVREFMNRGRELSGFRQSSRGRVSHVVTMCLSLWV